MIRTHCERSKKAWQSNKNKMVIASAGWQSQPFILNEIASELLLLAITYDRNALIETNIMK